MKNTRNEIIKILSNYFNNIEIAKVFNLTREAIRLIINRKNLKYIKISMLKLTDIEINNIIQLLNMYEKEEINKYNLSFEIRNIYYNNIINVYLNDKYDSEWLNKYSLLIKKLSKRFNILNDKLFLNKENKLKIARISTKELKFSITKNELLTLKQNYKPREILSILGMKSTPTLYKLYAKHNIPLTGRGSNKLEKLLLKTKLTKEKLTMLYKNNTQKEIRSVLNVSKRELEYLLNYFNIKNTVYYDGN